MSAAAAKVAVDPSIPSSTEAQALEAYIGESAHCQDKWLANIDQMLPE
jgi:hypothetical protein